jgi:hypothetical protein
VSGDGLLIGAEPACLAVTAAIVEAQVENILSQAFYWSQVENILTIWHSTGQN